MRFLYRVLIIAAGIITGCMVATATYETVAQEPEPSARIRVVKDLVPSPLGPGPEFSFSLQGPVGVDLDSSVSGVQTLITITLRDEEVFVQNRLPAGAYTLRELSTAGYPLREVQCRNYGEETPLSAWLIQRARVDIVLIDGGRVECIFTNVRDVPMATPSPSPVPSATPIPSATPLPPTPMIVVIPVEVPVTPIPAPMVITTIKPPATGDAGLTSGLFPAETRCWETDIWIDGYWVDGYWAGYWDWYIEWNWDGTFSIVWYFNGYWVDGYWVDGYWATICI